MDNIIWQEVTTDVYGDDGVITEKAEIQGGTLVRCVSGGNKGDLRVAMVFAPKPDVPKTTTENLVDSVKDIRLHEEAYISLYKGNIASEGALNHLLNQVGLCNMTVCPCCHCDDFTHVEGCEILAGIEKG